MKIFSKKISIGMGLAILFIVSSVVYSIGYKLAMEKFNYIVSSTQAKEKMYGALSEINYYIKNEYLGSIDENKILNGIYKGYISGLEDENCKILSREEYLNYLEAKGNIIAEVSWDELEDLVGYLRIGSLGKGSCEMFLERVNYFSLKGIDKIILDFRMSSEGEMDEGFKILKEILPPGDLIEKVNQKDDKEVICKSESPGLDAKIVVITGRKTSGVSEIIALALKEFLGSKIVGEKTRGNNISEKGLYISEDLAIIFPSSKYITSQGTDINKKGLFPDELVEIGEGEEKLFFNDDLPYSQDVQLQRAICLLKG